MFCLSVFYCILFCSLDPCLYVCENVIVKEKLFPDCRFFFLLFFRHEWLEFKNCMSVILIFNTRFFVHLCWQSAHNCGRFIFPDLFCRRNKSLWFLFHHKSWDKLKMLGFFFSLCSMAMAWLPSKDIILCRWYQPFIGMVFFYKPEWMWGWISYVFELSCSLSYHIATGIIQRNTLFTFSLSAFYPLWFIHLNIVVLWILLFYEKWS